MAAFPALVATWAESRAFAQQSLFHHEATERISKDSMEMLDETERHEQGGLSRDLEILTPEIIALRALVDHLGEEAA